MKKLIVFSVIFALIAGSVFAVDLGGEVIGTFHLLDADTNDADDYLYAGAEHPERGGMNRLRLQGAGENGDGTFGAWIRAEAGGFAGNAWWKPIDQLLVRLGSNGGDGFWGKEGVTGWMFQQRVADTGIVYPGNAWGGTYAQWPYRMRGAFYGGYGDDRLALEITPMDMLAINLGIPFSSGDETLGDVFASTVAQVDLNFDFGNIAITYQGAPIDDVENGAQGDPYLYAYFGLTAIDNLALDIGLGVDFADGAPLFAGLGLKVDISDAFGIKFRAVGGFGGDDKNLGVLANVLPYFALSDNLKVFADLGLNMTIYDDSDKDALVGWHVNPYLWIGEEWGPSFWVGVNLWSDGEKTYGKNGDKSCVNIEIPVAIGVSF